MDSGYVEYAGILQAERWYLVALRYLTGALVGIAIGYLAGYLYGISRVMVIEEAGIRVDRKPTPAPSRYHYDPSKKLTIPT